MLLWLPAMVCGAALAVAHTFGAVLLVLGLRAVVAVFTGGL